MRIDVYHDELTSEPEVVWTEPHPGERYCGLRIFLEEFHYDARLNDDQSPMTCAVTFLFESRSEVEKFVRALTSAIERAKENKL